MRIRGGGWEARAMRLVVMALIGLLPLRAYADDRDAAEIGHAIWFMGVFSLFFLGAMSLAIWLLVVRLRSGPPSVPEVTPHYPSLEKVWSKEARAEAALPPAPAVVAKES